MSQRVNTVASQLPDDASTPSIQKFDPADQPILTIAVTAPGEDLISVQNYADNTLQPELQRVEGVADVSVVGPVDREIQVLLNPSQLQSYGLSPSQVSNAISAAAIDLPIGDITFSGFAHPADRAQHTRNHRSH